MTNTQKIDEIIGAQTWDNWTNEQEDEDGNPTGKPEYWDVCQVLYCKLDHLKDSLSDLAEANGDEEGELDGHLETLAHVQTILEMLDEKALASLPEKV